MLKIKSLMFCFSAVLLASSAQANLLNFEDLTTEAAVSLNSVVDNYGGFTWSPSFTLYNDAAFPTQVHSGTYGVVNNDGASPVSISSAVAFDFGGLWLGGWSVNAPLFITISGFDAANHLLDSVTQVITEGAPVYVDANFAAVNRLEFSGGQYFTVDDFTFNKKRSNVPDPSSFFLLGIGILALAVVRRKSEN